MHLAYYFTIMPLPMITTTTRSAPSKHTSSRPRVPCDWFNRISLSPWSFAAAYLLFSEQQPHFHFGVGGETLPAHVLFLATRSEYFRGMLRVGVARKVEGHTPAAFHAMRSYMYRRGAGGAGAVANGCRDGGGTVYPATELHGVALRMALCCLGMC